MFANTTSEDENVQSSESRRVCTDEFRGLVTEQSNCVRTPLIRGFPLEQIAHVGAVARNTQQAGLSIEKVVHYAERHGVPIHKIEQSSRIHIAAARSHNHAG